MDEDEALAAAIAASLETIPGPRGVLLSSEHTCTRSELPRTPLHLANAPPGLEGRVHQVNTVNQFNTAHFGGAIETYQAPRAICGYTSVATAIVAAEALARGGGVEGVVEAARDLPPLTQHVEHMMQFTASKRSEYVIRHPETFPGFASGRGGRAGTRYMRNWVANYEISDYLQSLSVEVRKRVGFLRFNEWPERDHAKHEELERLEEMREFGGRPGDKGSGHVFDREAGDSAFVVETFWPKRKLQRPEEFVAEWESTGAKGEDRGQGLVLVVDLNGHFATCFMLMDGGEDGGHVLTVLNTTDTSYLHGSGGLALSEAFDVLATVKCWGMGRKGDHRAGLGRSTGCGMRVHASSTGTTAPWSLE